MCIVCVVFVTSYSPMDGQVCTIVWVVTWVTNCEHPKLPVTTCEETRGNAITLPRSHPIPKFHIFLMGWDRGWVMAFPLVSALFWGVEYDRPSLNPFCFSEKIFCFLFHICSSCKHTVCRVLNVYDLMYVQAVLLVDQGSWPW